MSDLSTFILIFFFGFLGLLFGYQFGEANAKQAIQECEKELPRNVNCKLIAVPADKN